MYSEIEIFKAGLGSSIIVNELTGTLKYPVRRFEWNPPTRGDQLPKMQLGGSHDRYSDVDSMLIVMEGDILADTTTAYWTNRLALLDKIMPVQDQTFRYHSHIQISLDGGTTYYANVTLQDWDCPTEALYPTRTPFIFQWENPYGYWRRVSDNVIVAI